MVHRFKLFAKGAKNNEKIINAALGVVFAVAAMSTAANAADFEVKMLNKGQDGRWCSNPA